MRLRHLEVVIDTSAGRYGARIPFENGLTVLRANNSSGKSTCLMAILYAFGLEGMLGPSHAPPFADVMIESLLDQDRVVSVDSSFVRLEVENDHGVVLTLRRAVATKDSTIPAIKARQLVHVTEGAAISAPDHSYVERDYFVKLKHAAQHEHGFHYLLAKFAGWDLPMVSSVDSGEVPLYLEVLFPFFFVDQLSGWRDIKARMPTYLRIPEMAKRATEFILKLDILNHSIQRQTLSQREDALKQTWRNRMVSAKSELQGSGIIIQSIPDSPSEEWSRSTSKVMYTDGNDWMTVEHRISRINSRLRSLNQPDMRAEGPQDEQYSLRLRDAESQLEKVRDRLGSLEEKERLEASNLNALDKRLETLSEELREYKDTKTILDRGGFAGLKTASGQCPTCRQPLKDTLLPQQQKNVPMSLEDNIDYIKDEYDTYSEMRSHIISAANSRAVLANELRKQHTALVQQIRELRRSLLSVVNGPSPADVGEQIRLEHELDRVKQAGAMADGILKELETVNSEFVAVRRDMENIGEDKLSEGDREKLRLLSESFVSQLRDYGFRSFDVAEVQISADNYRPIRHGYDIGLTSASDAIRLIWAYLLAMLELHRQKPTNHVGFLVFDEPKQQNAQDISVKELLIRAANALSSRQQVIVATSEESDRLLPMLKGVRCKVFSMAPGARLIAKDIPVPPSIELGTEEVSTL